MRSWRGATTMSTNPSNAWGWSRACGARWAPKRRYAAGRGAGERELLGFLSSWGNRRASLWIDEATGLFVGEVAEAYLTSAAGHERNESMSILAMTIDRLDGYRSAHGEKAANGILAQV